MTTVYNLTDTVIKACKRPSSTEVLVLLLQDLSLKICQLKIYLFQLPLMSIITIWVGLIQLIVYKLILLLFSPKIIIIESLYFIGF